MFRSKLLIIFATFTVTFFVYLTFTHAPRLALVPGKQTSRLLFSLNRHADSSSKFKPVKKSDLDWSRPKPGIVPALRHYRHLISHQAQDDVSLFWRDFYEHELLNWLMPKGPQKYVETMRAGKSMIITGGGISFQRVVFLIESVKAMECKADAIEVYYCRKDPFDDRQIKWLSEKYSVVPLLIDDLIPGKTEITVDTIKLYAALVSPFAEMVVINQDAVLFTCPTDYFETKQYKKSGALFFLDRALHPNNDALVMFILDKLFPQPLSSQLAHSPMITQASSFQQDSSLVVLNKSDGNWLGLVAAIAFTTARVRSEWGGNFRGDKESWWMGFEAAGLDYAFESLAPASIGFTHDQEGVCGGKLLHFVSSDKSQQKMAGWASGGVDRSENDGPKFDYFRAVSDGSGKWTLGLCQAGPQTDLTTSDAYGLVDRLELLKKLYNADPLI